MRTPRINTLAKLFYEPRKPSIWDDVYGSPLIFNKQVEITLIKHQIRDILNKKYHRNIHYAHVNFFDNHKKTHHSKHKVAYPKKFVSKHPSKIKNQKIRGLKRKSIIYKEQIEFIENYEKLI